MNDAEIISRIVAEWLSKPILKRYEKIGKNYLNMEETK